MSDPAVRARKSDEAATSAASMATAVLLSLIVVGASFTLSFNALADLARMSGAIPESLTFLLPVVVDVFILQATWCVYVATRRGDDAGKRYHFAMLATFSTISVVGNAGHAFLATDQGAMHGFLAVAIAIVAPTALLASIHGLVMHVWTGSYRTAHEASVRSPQAAAEDYSAPAPNFRPLDTADEDSRPEPPAQPPISDGSGSSTPEGVNEARATLNQVDDLVTQADIELAHLVCTRGRVRHDERAVARVLVLERDHVGRDEMAKLIGVHRTTIGRWIELADECRPAVDAPSEPARADAQTLVDVG